MGCVTMLYLKCPLSLLAPAFQYPGLVTIVFYFALAYTFYVYCTILRYSKGSKVIHQNLKDGCSPSMHWREPRPYYRGRSGDASGAM